VWLYFSAYLMRSSAPNPGQKDHGQHNKGPPSRGEKSRSQERAERGEFWVGLRGVVCTEKSNQLTKGEKKIGKITYLGIQWKIQHFLTFLYTFSSASLYAFSFVVVVISFVHGSGLWMSFRGIVVLIGVR